MMHGSISNKKYVLSIVPFMKTESRVNRIDVGGPRTWFIYDRRSGKLWGGPFTTEAKAWREIADVIRKNDGSLIDHAGKTAIEVMNDNR